MNNYHIYEEIGRGKYSVVYKGRKKKTIEYVAIKSVDRNRKKKLMNEVRLIHSLDHTNVLRFHNWYETRNHLWIIFEYCPAGDLKKLLEDDRKLPEPSVKRFIYEIVEGLSYLHEKGIIFSDLKPGNILINEFSQLKLADFGLSKTIQDLTSASEGSQEQKRLDKEGSVYYMAPELFKEDGVPSFFSDFWSLGIMMYQMATGHVPFEQTSLQRLLRQIVEEPVQDVSNFSDDFNDLLHRLLEKDPVKRITWHELRTHPFWYSQAPVYQFKRKAFYPEQPQFDRYLVGRGIDPATYHAQRANPIADRFLRSNSLAHKSNEGNLDILRLSMNVKRNMKKEQEENAEADENYHSSKDGGGPVGTKPRVSRPTSTQPAAAKQAQAMVRHEAAPHEDDISLQDKNVVLNFGDKQTIDDDTSAQLSDQHTEEEKSSIVPSFYPQSANASVQSEDDASGLAFEDAQAQQIFSGKSDRRAGNETPQSTATTERPRTNEPKGNILPLGRPNIIAQVAGQQNSASKPQGSSRLNLDANRVPSGQTRGNNTNRRNSSESRQPSSASQGRKYSIKKKPIAQQAYLTTSPSDLTLLAENQLFQAYQVVQRRAGDAQPASHRGDPAKAGKKDLLLQTKNNTGAWNETVQPMIFEDSNHHSDKSLTSGASGSSKQSKVPHKPIEQLIIHNSDNQVKPIIGNKDIEKVQEVHAHPDSLPFKTMDPQRISELIDSKEIETHLSDVYSALAKSESFNGKLNALNYFESIIINSNVSNRLINSAFMQLLVKMLRMIKKSPGIKSRLCSVIGLLIRHSTVIENELAETKICEVLVETMQEPSDKVRRKAIAALGEYMFYAATQLDDEHVDPIWELSYESIQTIVKCLRIQTNVAIQAANESGEDDIVRFYACKTLENICAQSNSAGHKFATLETINHLLAIFLSPVSNFGRANAPKQQPQFYEALKTSAAVALSHICNLNPQLFQAIFDRVTAPVYCHTLTEGVPRVQQAFITMLNLALTANVFPRINEILLNEPAFLPSLISLHEHQQIVIRGKCLLTFLLLFKLDFRWMSVVQNQVKFFNQLDRVLKDNYKYVQCCLLCLIDGILEIVPTIFQTVAQEMATLIKANGTEMPRLQETDFERGMSEQQADQLRQGGNLFFISVILDLQTNSLIRNRMLNYPFVRSLSALLDNVAVLINVSVQNAAATDGSSRNPLLSIAYEFQRTLLLLAESISTNHKVIIQMSDAIISFLLPVLLSKVKQVDIFNPQDVLSGKLSESRFLSLKIITDILIVLLNEESIYTNQLPVGTEQGVTPQQQQQTNFLSTQKINAFLLDGLLPMAAQLLSQSDPEPFYGQRLLSAILDKNRKFVKTLRSLTVVPSGEERKGGQPAQQRTILELITDFYMVNHANLNKHTIITVEALMEAQEVSLQELRDFKIIDKTHQLIQTMLANKKEWCIELLLDINHHLLTRFNAVVKTRERDIVHHIEEIFANFDVCVQLLSDHFEEPIIEKASLCLIQMLQLYALCQKKEREIFFVETHMPYLIRALDCDKKTVQKRVLKCIYWALIQGEYQINLDQANLLVLTNKVESLMDSHDKSISGTSKQIYKLLKEQAVQQQNQPMLGQPGLMQPGMGQTAMGQPGLKQGGHYMN